MMKQTLSPLQLHAIVEIIKANATAADAACIAEACRVVMDDAEAKRKLDLFEFASSLMPGLRSICRTCDFGYDAIDYYFGGAGIWTWYANEQEPRSVATHANEHWRQRPPHLTRESHNKIVEFIANQ